MIVYGFAVGELKANCYLVGDSATRVTAVIDPGNEYDRILSECAKRNLTIEVILLTHAHPDHMGAAIQLQQFTKADLYCHQDEIQVLQAILLMSGIKDISADMIANRTLLDGDEVKVGGLTIKAIHTPGHTPGGVCYYAHPFLFTGDTLFRRSIGRTDIPGGDYPTLQKSIVCKLLPLPDDLVVLPGHMEKSKLGDEKLYNSFIKEMLANK